jgi:hypothetical protein
MNYVTVDSISLESNNKIPGFLVIPENSELNITPIGKEECLYRLGETLYRKILVKSQRDSKDNGIRYIPALKSLTVNFPEDRIRTILSLSETNA